MTVNLLIAEDQFNLPQGFVWVAWVNEPTHHPWGHLRIETQTIRDI